MKPRFATAWSLVATSLLAFNGLTNPVAAGEAADEAARLWKPVKDQPFLQEVGARIPTPKPVTSIAAHGDVLYAVMEGRLQVLEGDDLKATPGAPTGVLRLRNVGGDLWAAAETGVYRLSGATWQKVDDRVFTDFCFHLNQVYGATRNALLRFANGKFEDIRPPEGYLSTDTTMLMEDFSQLLADPVEIGPILRIASYSGTLYLLRPSGLALIEGKTFVPDPIDWGRLPSPVTRDMLAQGSRLFVATDRGLGVLRGMAMSATRGNEGLCYEDTTCLANGFDGDLWIGTTRGAIRKTEGEYHYFGADHWLPSDHVHDIAVAGRTVYIATEGGLGIIRYEPFTLAKKAAHFEGALDDWGFKRLGFIHKLYWSAAENAWLREISDNDGGHTAHYLAAMTFKFAATGDEQAHHEALEAFSAMEWLGLISPKPGFIARSIWSVKGDKGERGMRGSGGLPAKWYPTEDGLWLWKGDTSSDEVNAHFYAVSLFHDLAARGSEKERAAQHVARLASHILENGWVLRDMDGKPTRWGRWDPEYLLRPYGFEARGLNGMEAQSYMQTAYALTGDAKFKQGLEQLRKWRYHTYTVRQRLTFPPESIAPWDDELAFFCYYPLLRYTQDPEMRSIYLRSLERTWEVLRMQQVPMYNFMYGALTGNDCEAPQAVRHLREWSLNLINYSYKNSHRHDLAPRSDYIPYSGGTRVISPRESEAKWEARSALSHDGGEGGQGVTPPIGWLADYWMGRYYGLILKPETQDAALLSPAAKETPVSGAKPYNGPGRPGLRKQ